MNTVDEMERVSMIHPGLVKDLRMWLDVYTEAWEQRVSSGTSEKEIEQLKEIENRMIQRIEELRAKIKRCYGLDTKVLDRGDRYEICTERFVLARKWK